MRLTSLRRGGAALALMISTVFLPTGPADAQSYGGTCNVGLKHKIAKDVYPRTIYYSGGARCSDEVFQDAQVWRGAPLTPRGFLGARVMPPQ